MNNLEKITIIGMAILNINQLVQNPSLSMILILMAPGLLLTYRRGKVGLKEYARVMLFAIRVFSIYSTCHLLLQGRMLKATLISGGGLATAEIVTHLMNRFVGDLWLDEE